MFVFTSLHKTYTNTCCGDLDVPGPKFGGRVKSGGSGLGISSCKIRMGHVEVGSK